MLDKEKVKELYINGYNAVEIAKKLHNNIEAVRKCIQRNFDYLKEQHEEALRVRRDSIRATNRESTKYMSDKAFILKNRSIYKTKPNGDIVLNREVSGVVTWDTPRILVNQDKSII